MGGTFSTVESAQVYMQRCRHPGNSTLWSKKLRMISWQWRILYLSAYGRMTDNGRLAAGASRLSSAINPRPAGWSADGMTTVQDYWIVQQLITGAAPKAIWGPLGRAGGLF